MTQEQFEAFVIKAATKKLDILMPNSTAERAAFVIKYIFKTASDHINLLVNNLDSAITNSPGYNDELEKAIKRGIEVFILYRDTPNYESKTNKMLERLVAEGWTNIHTKIFNEEAIKKLDSYKINNGNPFLFSESDNRMYRFEFENDGHKAWFNFNDSERSTRLSNMFTDIYSTIN